MELGGFSLGDGESFHVSNLLCFVIFIFLELHSVVFISSFINESKVERELLY